MNKIENRKLLKEGLLSNNIDATDKILDDFEKYKEILIQYNKVMNLTGITEEKEIYIKHFLDSTYIFKENYIKDNDRIIDIGTGAGFPGLPFKIVNKSISLTLLDSLNKRINFLKEVGNTLKLDNIEYLHGRAEDFGKKEGYRESFDIATARAVAALPVLLEYCSAYIKLGGYFICLKGPSIDDELKNSKKAMDILGMEFVEIIDVKLPDEDLNHKILVLKKVKSTPKKYPRNPGQISKKSIG